MHAEFNYSRHGSAPGNWMAAWILIQRPLCDCGCFVKCGKDRVVYVYVCVCVVNTHWKNGCILLRVIFIKRNVWIMILLCLLGVNFLHFFFFYTSAHWPALRGFSAVLTSFSFPPSFTSLSAPSLFIKGALVPIQSQATGFWNVSVGVSVSAVDYSHMRACTHAHTLFYLVINTNIFLSYWFFSPSPRCPPFLSMWNERDTKIKIDYISGECAGCYFLYKEACHDWLSLKMVRLLFVVKRGSIRLTVLMKRVSETGQDKPHKSTVLPAPWKTRSSFTTSWHVSYCVVKTCLAQSITRE